MKKKCFFGDIHNHCNASYAHGDLSDALANARLQLDFVSVTGHSSWPDIPDRKSPLISLVDYHNKGFNKLEKNWHEFISEFNKWNKPGEFICFPSYEIHSMQDGDHTVYFKTFNDKMFKPKCITEFQRIIRTINKEDINNNEAFITPHHIGYKTGYRGINWEIFNEDVSPVIEIISMHGCSENENSYFSYLHTMGPCESMNTMQGGLEKGFHFGVIGSTDHHSAHPGSYGYGKVAIWAEELTQDAIWTALKNRQCYAVSGDRIILDFKINECEMGSINNFSKRRNIKISLIGGDAIEYIEIIKNNDVFKRFNYSDQVEKSNKNLLEKEFSENFISSSYDYEETSGIKDEPLKSKIYFEFGWGEIGVKKDWDIHLNLVNGKIISAEPRLHGIDVIDPEQKHAEEYQFSTFLFENNKVFLRTATWGNPTPLTHTNQGVSLEIEAESISDAYFELKVNNHIYRKTLKELSEKSTVFYMKKFLSGAVKIHKLIPSSSYTKKEIMNDTGEGEHEDFYYIRVKQRNNQWAFSSPIWIKKKVE